MYIFENLVDCMIINKTPPIIKPIEKPTLAQIGAQGRFSLNLFKMLNIFKNYQADNELNYYFDSIVKLHASTATS